MRCITSSVLARHQLVAAGLVTAATLACLGLILLRSPSTAGLCSPGARYPRSRATVNTRLSCCLTLLVRQCWCKEPHVLLRLCELRLAARH